MQEPNFLLRLVQLGLLQVLEAEVVTQIEMHKVMVVLLEQVL